MASKIHVREVSRRVENLRQDKESLHSALDGYFEKIITTGNEWIQCQESSRRTFQEICCVLDQAMFYIEGKLIELSAIAIKGETGVLESASPLTDAPHSSTTTSTLTSPLPPLPVSSSFVTKSSTPPADQLLLKLQERMDDLESKTPTKSEVTDAIAEVKSGMEDTKKRVKKCEGHFDGLLERFNTSTKEYITNRSKDDARFKKCEERMNSLDQDTNQLTSDVSKVKRKVNSYDDSFSEVNRKIVNIDAKFVEVEKEKNTTITRIRGLEEGLETCQTQLGKVDGLGDKIRQIEDERERDRSRMKNAEERLGKLEEERIDLEIQRLGILEDRLLGMEEERQNDIKNFCDVKENLVRLTSRVDDVEKKQKEQHQPVGFTAYTEGTLSTTGRGVIKGFNKILSNKGGHYDATTGIFTAPVSGTYLASFCHRQSDGGARYLWFCHERASPGQRSLEIVGTWTEYSNANSSNVIVLDMVKDDKLYLKSNGAGGNIMWPCAFSCALLR